MSSDFFVGNPTSPKCPKGLRLAFNRSALEQVGKLLFANQSQSLLIKQGATIVSEITQ